MWSAPCSSRASQRYRSDSAAAAAVAAAAAAQFCEEIAGKKAERARRREPEGQQRRYGDREHCMDMLLQRLVRNVKFGSSCHVGSKVGLFSTFHDVGERMRLEKEEECLRGKCEKHEYNRSLSNNPYTVHTAR